MSRLPKGKFQADRVRLRLSGRVLSRFLLVGRAQIHAGAGARLGQGARVGYPRSVAVGLCPFGDACPGRPTVARALCLDVSLVRGGYRRVSLRGESGGQLCLVVPWRRGGLLGSVGCRCRGWGGAAGALSRARRERGSCMVQLRRASPRSSLPLSLAVVGERSLWVDLVYLAGTFLGLEILRGVLRGTFQAPACAVFLPLQAPACAVFFC